jgi:ParB family transcriptional regulator, chromosome partitioning protein
MAGSQRSRVERLRKDLKIAPPPVVTTEQLPARPAKRASRAKAPEATMPAPIPFQLVELKNLRRSDLNVRTTGADEDIKSLAADIEVHGVLQNLSVVPAKLGAKTYDVVAGGRRLAALHHLLDEHKINGEYLVPVRIHQPEDGRSTSLAENLHRVAMNPADEYLAYAAIVADHSDEPDPLAYCARRFSVSRSHVEQRLRLADLAPEILEALRQNRVGADAAKAYASFNDHTLQLQVFNAEEKRSYGTKHDPRAIRDAMKSKTYPEDCSAARYVGLDAYRAAGGRTDRELFMGDDQGERLLDPSLLDRLAREKATGELPAAAKRDGFASGLLTMGFNAYPAWPPAPSGYVRGSAVAFVDLSAEQRSDMIGVYTLEMGELKIAGYYRPSAIERSQPTPSIDWAAQRAKERHDDLVLLHAARKAVRLEDLPIASVAFYPDDDDPYCAFEPVHDEEGNETDDIYVIVRVLVKADEIEANRAQAEAEVAAVEEAERQRKEEERRQAEQAAQAEQVGAA